jgi:uncharacterized membrane protein YfcA
MAPPDLLPVTKLLVVVLISAVAGAMNAIAGGGTLLTFPALVWLGVPPLNANATSTVALVPGAIASIAGYRSELSGARRWALGFAIPSVLGGLLGAVLLRLTPADRFEALVPFLVLGATTLFIIQKPVMRWLAQWRAINQGAASAGPTSDAERTAEFPNAILLVYQFFIAVYGGYFGAGMGILMLAGLGFMGLTNIHRMNGLKNWGGACTNVVAAGLFAASGLVRWPIALAMTVGATSGGYLGSRLAQRVGQVAVRRAIVAIGFGSGIWMLVG